jgi:UDP-glucose 4-epimerase
MKGGKVLITGGLGFIGSNLAHRCLKEGASVTVYDCLDPNSGGNIYNVHTIRDDLEIVLEDIRNFDRICDSIKDKELIFHCAAYTSHPNSMREPWKDVDVNCNGTLNILEAARRFNPAAKIIQIGTSTQIGKKQFDTVDEMHPEFPVDIYSANKSASEKYVLIYGGAYQMKTTVVRLGNTYGPRSNIKSADLGFINYFIGLGLQNKEIPVFGDGKQRRNVLYIGDCINAIVEATKTTECEGKVLFATSDMQYTVSEIANEVATHVGGKVCYVDWPKERKAIEIGDIIISNSRLKCLLKWYPQVNLKSGLLTTKEYYQDCSDKYLNPISVRMKEFTTDSQI